MKLFKEPSKLFDNANGLFDDQKEMRLRKLNKGKEENSNAVKSSASKTQQHSSNGKTESPSTDGKKKN
uniref:Lipoprotein n=1 Tax=Caenorhabditis tropicalis TaxID=1561998 RepID=A0A1I7TKF6_9PELO